MPQFQWVYNTFEVSSPLCLSLLLWNSWKLWLCYTISCLDCGLLKIVCSVLLETSESQRWMAGLEIHNYRTSLEMAQVVTSPTIPTSEMTKLQSRKWWPVALVRVRETLWFWTLPWTTFGCTFSHVMDRTLNRYSELLRLCVHLFIVIFIVSLCTVFFWVALLYHIYHICVIYHSLLVPTFITLNCGGLIFIKVPLPSKPLNIIVLTIRGHYNLCSNNLICLIMCNSILFLLLFSLLFWCSKISSFISFLFGKKRKKKCFLAIL